MATGVCDVPTSRSRRAAGRLAAVRCEARSRQAWRPPRALSLAAMRDWSGRPVAVTGAGGFIGSHLAEELVARGAEVQALVHYNGRGDRGALEWLVPEVVDQMR